MASARRWPWPRPRPRMESEVAEERVGEVTKRRLSADVGGTFTDLVVHDHRGSFELFKSPTTPDDPVRGVFDVLALAAAAADTTLAAFLAGCDLFMHATTRATNAVLTGGMSRVAFLTTEGHPDILLLREGGRVDPFDNTVPFPEPLVPRSLTFEVPERIGADGRIFKPLDEAAMLGVIASLRERDVESVGVCLIWSIVNAVHEERVGALLAQHLPGVPYTLSHRLNPSLREYRRASSTCIDAALKPIMSAYLGSLEARLREAGFDGRLLGVTSQGSVADVTDLADSPIHSINSGPSMAPVAGGRLAQEEGDIETAIVADTGGTSYDVSLVRNGRIPWTRETWLGPRLRGHMTGFPSIDVRSIGAGGGSIAWVDGGGMLHVGPDSAGSVPGPVCYGHGGTRPTVTDAAVVLGYVDAYFFLGGSMQLDRDAAREAISTHVARPLRLKPEAAAAAVFDVVSENMVHAIEDITINQGIDPREAMLIGGGGAAGLNSVAIARRLGCRRVLIPAVGATLSAAGALMSDLSAEYSHTAFTTSDRFDMATVNATLDELEDKSRRFMAGRGTGTLEQRIDFSVEGRYPHQVWEIEVPLVKSRFEGPGDVDRLVADLHDLHEEMFAIADRQSHIEAVTWRARATCRLARREGTPVIEKTPGPGRGIQNSSGQSRPAYFDGVGVVETAVRRFEMIPVKQLLVGPVIIESSFTTVVVGPGASVERTAAGNLTLNPNADSATDSD